MYYGSNGPSGKIVAGTQDADRYACYMVGGVASLLKPYVRRGADDVSAIFWCLSDKTLYPTNDLTSWTTWMYRWVVATYSESLPKGAALRTSTFIKPSQQVCYHETKANHYGGWPIREAGRTVGTVAQNQCDVCRWPCHSMERAQVRRARHGLRCQLVRFPDWSTGWSPAQGWDVP